MLATLQPCCSEGLQVWHCMIHVPSTMMHTLNDSCHMSCPSLLSPGTKHLDSWHQEGLIPKTCCISHCSNHNHMSHAQSQILTHTPVDTNQALVCLTTLCHGLLLFVCSLSCHPQPVMLCCCLHAASVAILNLCTQIRGSVHAQTCKRLRESIQTLTSKRFWN